jgi:hypothetical protein
MSGSASPSSSTSSLASSYTTYDENGKVMLCMSKNYYTEAGLIRALKSSAPLPLEHLASSWVASRIET